MKHNLVVISEGYQKLKSQYRDLQDAYNKKSILRVIERVTDDKNYDMMVNQGDSVTVYKPRKSEKKHSSKSRKRHRDVERLSDEPTKVISLNKPINRYSTEGSASRSPPQQYREQIPIHLDQGTAIPYASSNYIPVKTETISEASQSRDERSEESGNYKTYPVDPVMVPTPQQSTTVHTYYGNQMLKHTTPIGKTTYQRESSTNTIAGANQNIWPSQNPAHYSQDIQPKLNARLRHTQQTVVADNIPIENTQVLTNRSVSFGERDYEGNPLYAHRTYTKTNETVNSLINSGQTQNLPTARFSQGPDTEFPTRQSGLHRIDEAGSGYEYSNEKISYLTGSNRSSMARPSTDLYEGTRPGYT